MKIGNNVQLKFDIYNDGVLLGHQGDFVKIFDKPSNNQYIKVIKNGVILNVRNFEIKELFKIPEFINILPTDPGYYLYKATKDTSPTYCELKYVNDKLCIASGNKGHSINEMHNMYWLKVH